MAQSPVFYTIGSMQVSKAVSYTTADLPTVPAVTIDTLRISEAPRIWRADIAQDGTHIQKDGKPSYTKGNQRGARVTTTRAGVTYTSPNVPTLYKEGEEIALHDDSTYVFYNDCIVEYGTKK